MVIIANVDQEASESTAQLVVDGLPLLGATETCTSSFVPFMCLYLFPLCDGNGTVTRPSRDQCIEISTVICKDEWQKALAISSVKEKLPKCESLALAREGVCKGNNCMLRYYFIVKNASLEVIGGSNLSPNSTRTFCTDSFLFSNGTCVPQCGKWKQYDDEMSLALDIFAIISAVIGLGSGILVLLFSCIWHKHM